MMCDLSTPRLIFQVVWTLIFVLVQVLLSPSLLLLWGGSILQPAYLEVAIFNATALNWTLAAPLLQARYWSGFAASSNATGQQRSTRHVHGAT